MLSVKQLAIISAIIDELNREIGFYGDRLVKLSNLQTEELTVNIKYTGFHSYEYVDFTIRHIVNEWVNGHDLLVTVNSKGNIFTLICRSK